LNSGEKVIPVAEISIFIYQCLARIHQQQPGLFLEKYRALPWNSDRHQSALMPRLEAALGNVNHIATVRPKVQQILQVFLGNIALESSNFAQLNLELSQLLSPLDPTQKVELQSGNGSKSQPVNDLKTNSDSNTSSAIAILLLDAENLQIDAKTEQFLARNCTHPIQIKIAFANWRNMGKQDVELHKRGYELIHVPAGKDSADVKMATVGSSIFVHYPTAKEVLVCSSDKVMTHLCTTLKTHGLTVYLVHKKENFIQVLNHRTGKTETFNPEKPLEIPPLRDCIVHLKQIMQDEQRKTGEQWLELAKISKIFQQESSFTISQMMSKYFPGKKARELFTEHPEHFVVHQLSDPKSSLYITLFQANAPVVTKDLGSSEGAVDKSKSAHDVKISKINSPADLEKIFIEILQELMMESKEVSISLALFGSAFSKKYSQPANTVIKEKLKTGGTLIKFLKSSQLFKVELKQKEWRIAIAAKTQK
jgi:hypothetical protein